MKIVIAGSSGFVGTHLSSFLEKEGHSLIHLSRNPQQTTAYYWNPEKREIDPTVLHGADVVINLSGESILGRWTPHKMKAIKESRLQAAQFLCDTLLTLPSLPQIYIGASAIGYYGDRPQEVLDESSSPGTIFLSEVCTQWEQVPQVLTQRGVRVALARLGIVLGEGGALKQMDKAFRMGMGGILGSGEQIMSWIAVDDVCGAMHHVIAHPELKGAVNFVAPHPVSNQVFTQTLGNILHRPAVVPIPKFALNLLFGQGAEMFLSSVQVAPKRLLETGYHFQYPDLEGALRKYLLIKV